MSRKDTGDSGRKCPESTIESAHRRNFIRKAALVSASAAIGSTVLGSKIIPESSARSSTTVKFSQCCSTGIAIEGVTDSGVGVYGLAKKPCGVGAGVVGTSGGFCGPLPKCCTEYNGVVGVSGWYRCAGQGALAGVKGMGWCAGVVGIALTPCAVPLSARGCTSQANDLQRWQIGCTNTPLSVVNKKGWFGIGTATPLYVLCVVGTTVSSCSACCGRGVVGNAHGSSGSYGVVGESSSANGAGVAGANCSGPGVLGEATSVGGIGVKGLAIGGSVIPLVAQAAACQSVPLQEWQNSSGSPLSVVNKSGWLGVGTSTPSSPLDVIGGSPVVGTIKSNASSGDRSAVVQYQNGDTTAVDWNVGVAGLCNSIKVPDGYFYVQHSTKCTPAISINKCNNHVGFGIANPCRVLCVNGRIHTQCGMGLGTQTINTTLAINGSLSVKSRQVSATTTLTLSDYVVAADAAVSAFTITLPSVSSTAGACNGMMLFIKKADSSTNAVTITASGTDTIEGNASVVLKKQYDSLQLVSNNSGGNHVWFILQSAKCGVAVS
jgi:hypothetical protein